jgi:tRNA (cmo5U34)-methyltransferase
VRISPLIVRQVRKRATQCHFEPASYVAEIIANVPHYLELQAAVAAATRGMDVRAVLDLGIGTGETAAAVLEVHPHARVTGVDASAPMLAVARERIAPDSVAELIVRKLQDPLPAGDFDLVVSSLAVHHLRRRQKRDLFRRIRNSLGPGGCFVLADVVRPARRQGAVTRTSTVHDRLERPGDLERWLAEAGFSVGQAWSAADLVVLRALAPGGPRRSAQNGRDGQGLTPRGP